jgi:hypothetical protein
MPSDGGRQQAALVLLAGAGGLIVGISIADFVRAALARWMGGKPCEPAAPASPAADGEEEPQPLMLRQRSVSTPHGLGVAHTYERTSVSSLRALTPPASPELGEQSSSFRRLRRSQSISGVLNRSPRMKHVASENVLGGRRSRMDYMSSTGRSRHSDESFASPQVELATDDARRMMASSRKEFATAETVMFVLNQMMHSDAADEIKQVVTPAEKLQGAFKRVRDGIHFKHALQDAGGKLKAGPSAAREIAGSNPEFLSLKRGVQVPRELSACAEATRCLANVADWDFDIFALDKATNGHSLVALGDHLLAPICAALSVGEAEVHSFLSCLEAAYRTDVPYHTATHAADVMHGASWLLRSGMLPAVSADDAALLQLSVLLAAAAHDACHPGVNADFLMKTGDPLALLYNDRSVLESMHAAVCFRLLSSVESNVLLALQPEQRARLRAWVIAMILSTDMKGHYTLLARLAETELWSQEDSLPAEEHAFALGVLLHAADLGGPTKPSVVVRWSRRVAEEFFMQGEREAKLGLKVSDGFDRKTAGSLWPQRNAAFVSYIVVPLFDAIRAAAPDADLTAIEEGIDGSLLALDKADPEMPIE